MNIVVAQHQQCGPRCSYPFYIGNTQNSKHANCDCCCCEAVICYGYMAWVHNTKNFDNFFPVQILVFIGGEIE